MNQPKQRQITSTLVLVILGGVLILANLALVGVDATLRQTAQDLKVQIENIHENLEQLKQVDEGRLASMREETAQAEAELSMLEASFPELGAPIALYNLSFNLASKNKVNIQSISRNEGIVESTVVGQVETVQYSLELQGEIDACIAFIKQLERAGMDTISVENIQMNSELQNCRMDVLTMGNANQLEP